jgi:hypothetical protein
MTTPRIRRHIAAAIFSAALIAVLAAPSVAGTSYSTNLFLSRKAPAFHGKVHSPATFCRVHRKVRLYRVRSGPDKLLGSDHSEENGAWKVEVERLRSGAYYAKAKRFSSAALGFTCRPDRSRLALVD